MIFIRSLIFNILFFIFNAFASLALSLWLFMPHKSCVKMIRTFYAGGIFYLEKYIIGLTYEVRGKEHLPDDNRYIVAAKHQSAYETIKLHVLFDDPAIILKRELTWIPVWGWFLMKLKMIAIDRSAREKAVEQIISGAKRVFDSNRPLIIFPQGTRVQVGVKKPYKGGIAKLYEKTEAPVIPMAINAGYFWPKHGFIKKPGVVVFEFLPPIEQGLTRPEFMKTLETQLEAASDRLAEEAQQKELQA